MVNRLPALAVAVGGFFLYLLTSYPFPDWLDSPELITAAFRLGGFHPPGSPLAVMLGHLFCLWPFAPPAAALLYFSAVFAALALYVLTRTVQDLFKALGPADQRPGTVAAVILGCAFMLCGGLWSQAVRTEVYTLALLLFLGTLRELVLLSVEVEKKPDRVIRAAALCGMGLCVHPLMALAVTPAVLMLAAWRPTRNLFLAPGQLLRSAIAFLLGLAPLLLIPLMVRAPVDLRWGDPTTLAGWFETILGLTFSHSFTEVQAEGTGLMTLIVILSGVGVGLSVLAALGLYPLLRKKLTLALILICTSAICVLSLALQKSVRLDNPDVFGYALPAAAALFFLAAGGLAVSARMLSRLRSRLSWIAVVLAVLALAATVLSQENKHLNRSGCTAGRRLAERALTLLPEKSVAIVADFNLAFMLEYLIHVEGIRADVGIFYLRDLDNPALRAALARAEPELEARLPGVDRLDRDSLGRLGELRPVAIDGGPHLKTSLLFMPVLKGLFWLDGPEKSPREEKLVCDALSFYSDIRPVCAAGVGDPRTADVATWHAYWQSLGAKELGLNDLSRILVAVAKGFSPLDRTVTDAQRRLGIPPTTVACPVSPKPAAPPLALPRPPVLPAVFLLLGLLAWGVPLIPRGRAWFHPLVSLAGLLCLELVLWLG